MTTVVEGNVNRPPKVSLITAAEIGTEPTERWIDGYYIQYDSLGMDSGIVETCNDDTPKTSDDEESKETLFFKPFVVWAADECSTFGFKEADYQERAVAALIATESFWIERELFADTLALGNPNLTGSIPIAPVVLNDTDTVDPYMAIAMIEDAQTDYDRGSQTLMIHMRPYEFDILLYQGGNSLIHREGNRWVTGMGNIIVPEHGHLGYGPEGSLAQPLTADAAWIYATPMVTVRRGQIETFASEMRENINIATNDVRWIAERAVSYSYNANFPTLAVNVTRRPGIQVIVP